MLRTRPLEMQNTVEDGSGGRNKKQFSCLHIIKTYPSFLSPFQYSVKEMVGIFHKVLGRK